MQHSGGRVAWCFVCRMRMNPCIQIIALFAGLHVRQRRKKKEKTAQHNNRTECSIYYIVVRRVQIAIAFNRISWRVDGACCVRPNESLMAFLPRRGDAYQNYWAIGRLCRWPRPPQRFAAAAAWLCNRNIIIHTNSLTTSRARRRRRRHRIDVWSLSFIKRRWWRSYALLCCSPPFTGVTRARRHTTTTATNNVPDATTPTHANNTIIIAKRER